MTETESLTSALFHEEGNVILQVDDAVVIYGNDGFIITSPVMIENCEGYEGMTTPDGNVIRVFEPITEFGAAYNGEGKFTYWVEAGPANLSDL